MDFQIVSAGSDDFEQVFALLLQLWPGRQLDREKIRQVYNQALAAEQQEYIIAKDRERVIGLITLRIVTNLWAQGNLMEIEELVVDEAYRSRQIGSRLLQKSIAIAAENRCRTVEVTSNMKRTQAHKFYEMNGFKKLAFHFLFEMNAEE